MRIDKDKYVDEFLFHCIRCGTIFYASREDDCDFEEEFNFSCGKQMGSCNCPECGDRVYSTQKGMSRKDQSTVHYIASMKYRLTED